MLTSCNRSEADLRRFDDETARAATDAALNGETYVAFS